MGVEVVVVVAVVVLVVVEVVEPLLVEEVLSAVERIAPVVEGAELTALTAGAAVT